MSGPRLAPTIALPTTPNVATADLVRAFGVTRQALWKWRRGHGFPLGEGGISRTAPVAAWCAARGCAVRWV